MKDFKKAATSATSNSSFIMEGREKIGNDLLIATYPDGITITGADLITGENGQYAVCTFAENDKQFINGGKMLTDIVKEWLDGYTGAEEMSADLKASGGVKMKFEKTKTKSGRDFVSVTIV